jgi:hypothetical protein
VKAKDATLDARIHITRAIHTPSSKVPAGTLMRIISPPAPGNDWFRAVPLCGRQSGRPFAVDLDQAEPA